MSSSSDNLLIDLDNSPSSQSSFTPTSQQTITSQSKHQQNESVAAYQSQIPLFELLNRVASLDLNDNNPFDRMDKQAGLLDDPFEIVENAVTKSNMLMTETPPCPVETATLIAFDSTPPPHNVNLDEISPALVQSPLDSDENKCETQMTPTSISMNELTSKNMSTPLARPITRGKSNPLNLLKFSLAKRRVEAPNFNSLEDISNETPSESSLGDDQATILQKKLLKSKELTGTGSSSAEDSFEDLAATKPNWVDSETDIELDNDIDCDLAKLNIPMLNKVSAEIEAKNSPNLLKETPSGTEPKSVMSIRDKLIEKFALIKFKKSCPQSDKENESITTDEIELTKSPVEIRHDAKDGNPDSLIKHLKEMIEKCDDKGKQTEAKNLLESLSSFFKVNSERNTPSSNAEKSCHLLTPPQPIRRQGTFSIDREEIKRENQAKHKEIDTEQTIENVQVDEKQLQAETPSLDPKLSQVLKDLQSVLGANQNINVVQPVDLGSSSEASAPTINPTYIVVVSTPNTDDLVASRVSTEANIETRRRSQSMSLRAPAMATRRASLVKSQCTESKTKMPEADTVERTVSSRRCSMSVVSRPPVLQHDASEKKPEFQAKTSAILRRRSIQGPITSSLRPPSPVKKPSPHNGNFTRNTAMSSSFTRRKSLSNANPAKDSPSKMRSSYGILKKQIAPPTAKNFKIRVKESLGGRSNAPVRAVVPINRVAPLNMINESVTPMADSKRKSLITSTPRPQVPPTPSRNLKLKNGKKRLFHCTSKPKPNFP